VTGPAPTKKVSDPTLLVGQKVVEESGEPSRSTSVRRRVYDSKGKLLYDTTFFSSYRGEAAVVRVGTKPKPEEPTQTTTTTTPTKPKPKPGTTTSTTTTTPRP